MYTEWKPEMSVGIGVIDVQHRKMVRNINEISEAVDVLKSNDEIIAAIGLFETYSHEHFKTEEDYMAIYRYPEYLLHQKDHIRILDDMKLVKEKFKLGQISAKEVHEESRKVADWFEGHMKNIDSKMATFLRGIVR